MDLEIRRQLVHLVTGGAALILIYHDLFFVPVFAAVLVLGALLSLVSRRHDVPGIAAVLDWLERDRDRYRLPGRGALFLLTGIVLAVTLFEKDVALAAVLTVTIGDSVTHLIGRYWGSWTHPLNEKKDLEGFIVGTLACFAVLLFILPVSAALVVALSAMLFESLDHRLDNKLIDDNLTIPLVVGGTYYGFTALTSLVLNVI